MKLPILCYRKHVVYVSVGDDQETDQSFDNEKIDSGLLNSECCLQQTICSLRKDDAFSPHCVASSLGKQASVLLFPGN